MDNNITINPEEILKMEDDSITDIETIRQIALLGDSTLFCKVKPGHTYAGLYPHVMKSFNISPE